MENFTPSFADAGFSDVEVGAELFGILHISQEDLILPNNRDLLAQIADFANKYGDAIPRIRQAMRKLPRGASSLQHASQYVMLQNKRMDLKQSLSALERELSMYE